MKRNLIYIDECPSCRQGGLIPVKDKKEDRYLLICDECELQWNDPEAILKGEPPLANEVAGVEEISKEEIEKIGWSKYIRKPFL